MKEFSVQVEKVTGQASDNAVCGVFSMRVEVAGAKIGTLTSCILVKGETGDLSEALKNIFELAQRKIENADGSVLAALKSATNAAKNFSDQLEVSLMHTFFYENACYVSRLGDGVKLFVFDPPKSVEIKFESGSGPVSGGQIYLIATEAFFSIFDTSVLAQDAEVDFEGIIDEIATDIAGEENQSEIGAAFVSVRAEGKDEAEEEEAVLVHQEQVDAVEQESLDESEKEQVKDELLEGESRVSKPNFFTAAKNKIFEEVGRVARGDLGAIRRNLITVATIVVIVLAVSVSYTLYQKNQREELARFNEHMTLASSKFEEGVSIIGLNKSRAREILVEADREVKLALDIRPDDEKGKKLAEDINQKLKEMEVTSNIEFKEVANLGDSIKSLGFSGNNIVGISGNKLFTVNLATGDSADIETVGGVDSGYVFDNKAFVFSGNKVSRVDITSGEDIEVGSKEGGLDIAVFSGNVYVLAKNSIAKFIPIEGGYSQGTEYLNAPQEFAAKSRFAIDGSVWVSAKSRVFKFTRGAAEDFEIAGLVGAIGELGAIYTNASLDNLYIVDTTNSALLVVNKDGVYQKVFQSSEFGRATDLIVNDDESKMYLTTGTKILEASLETGSANNN